MIPGAVHSSGIYLTSEENPGTPQLGDSHEEAVQPVIASNGVPFPQMRTVGPLSTSGREKELKRKGRGDGF